MLARDATGPARDSVHSASMRILRILAATLLASLVASNASAQASRPRVERAADLPRLEYRVAGRVDALLDEYARFAAFAGPLRRDLQAALDRHEFVDKAIERQLLYTLVQLDWLEGRHDAAMAALGRLLAGDDSSADTLALATVLRAVDGARRATGVTSGTAFRAEAGKRFRAGLDALPFASAEPRVKRAKAVAEAATEAQVLAEVRDAIQPIVDRGEPLGLDLARVIVDARYRLVVELPLKSTVVEAYAGYLGANRIAKPDIWAARDAALPPGRSHAPVPVAIWDSGVDASLFGERMLRDASGAPATIAFDRRAEPAQGDLAPIAPALKDRLPRLKPRLKGISDVQADIDSAEAEELKAFLASSSREVSAATIEELQAAGNYVHGTHVASIAAAGNPAIRLVVARIEFSHTLKPDPCPSLAQAQKDARNVATTIAFFRRHKVRVVNMSFAGSARDTETLLELCGVGANAAERRGLAREWFDLGKAAMASGIAGAPEILFVASAAAGPPDGSVIESVPADLVAPNLVTVGAVDRAGDEAPYTGRGRSVALYATGFLVDGVMPGGERHVDSGTAVAAPQVTNVAAKMLAVHPALTPVELIAILRDTAERSPDGRRALLHPQKALAAATAKRG